MFRSIEKEIGSRKVQNITKADMRKLQTKLAKGSEKKNPKKAATVNSVMHLLKQIFKQAKEDGLIIINPCEGIKDIRQSRKDNAANTIHRALTREEQAAFMEAAKGEWFYNMIDFMLRTGIRTGEARALQWRDLDYRQGVMHICHNVTVDEQGKLIISTPKTETSVRDIPLTAELRAVLERQRQQLREMFGNVQKIDSVVFPNVNGKILYSAQLNYNFRRIIRKMWRKGIEVKRFTAHCLRDTFATRAIESGMNPNTLKTILGHSSLSMTMDLYAHVLPDTKTEEMKKIAAAF